MPRKTGFSRKKLTEAEFNRIKVVMNAGVTVKQGVNIFSRSDHTIADVKKYPDYATYKAAKAEYMREWKARHSNGDSLPTQQAEVSTTDIALNVLSQIEQNIAQIKELLEQNR